MSHNTKEVQPKTDISTKIDDDSLNLDHMRICYTVILSRPIKVCHIIVGSPRPNVWQAARGDIADRDWSTHGPQILTGFGLW